MNRDDLAIDRVVAEIDRELEELRRLLRDFTDFRARYPNPDRHLLRAEASYLADFYNGAERIFRIIVEELDGGGPRGDSWHKRLLLDMTLDMQHRPRVLSDSLYVRMLKFLGFRHVVRQAYGFELDAARVGALADDLDGLFTEFRTEINAFGRSLRSGVS
jgi:hypothetical protein